MLNNEIQECMKAFSPNADYTHVETWRRYFSTILGHRVNERDAEEVICRFRAMKYLDEANGVTKNSFQDGLLYGRVSMTWDKHVNSNKIYGITRNSVPFWRSK